jgi:hydrogenase maturation protease
MRYDTLVVGAGNPDRGDDGAGVEVVRRLSRRRARGVRAVELGGDPTRLVALFSTARRIVIVDAMSSGARVGTTRRFDARRAPLPARAFAGSSTHTIDVATAIELGRALGILPDEIEVIGIEGARFDLQAARSAAVNRAIGRTVARIARPARCAILRPEKPPRCASCLS